MSDITKAIDENYELVTFSAASPKADIWMRQRCGDQTVTFRLPAEREQAIAFEAAADAMQLGVDQV